MSETIRCDQLHTRICRSWSHARRTYLVVADVVVALVHAASVRPGLKCSGDVLDVWDSVNEDCSRPAGLALDYRLQVDCIVITTLNLEGQNGTRTADALFFALYAQSRS